MTLPLGLFVLLRAHAFLPSFLPSPRIFGPFFFLIIAPTLLLHLFPLLIKSQQKKNHRGTCSLFYTVWLHGFGKIDGVILKESKNNGVPDMIHLLGQFII